jgi:pimeloyl-ACP methyl ester carboxylesterase
MADEPKKMEWSALLKKMSDIEVGKPLDVSIQKETIPIIFVPGVMGSRLKKDGDKVWDPDDALFMLWNYGMVWVTAAKKKKALIGDDFKPDDLKPLDDDADHNKKFAEVDAQTPPNWQTAATRGWGTVSWGTYGELLTKLQAKDTFPAPLRAFFDFPVYAIGYNWAASSVDSGRALAERISEVVDYHQSKDGLCKKVIVITHSMGGLVARWAVEKEGAKDKVLGVVHGVQPATGAAAGYWRMKAGFERSKRWGFEFPNPAAWVIGTNGEEVTALLGWMPGGLQLLPGPDYTDSSGSKKWLKLCDHEGKELASYGDDAATQIYKNEDPKAYWRLVEKSNLLPGKKSAVKPVVAWEKFCEKVDGAREFHEDVSGKAHRETQAFYGAGKKHPSCDRVEYRAVVYDWRAAAKDAATVINVVRYVAAPGVGTAVSVGFEILKRTEWWQSRGGFKVRVETDKGSIDVELQHPADVAKRNDDPHGAGAGDGTVPESSGKALKQRGDAVGGEKAAQAVEGIEHEPAYHSLGKTSAAEDPVVFTIQAVKNLCRDKIKKAR